MADVDTESNPNFALFELSAEEVIDIRRTALMAAAMVYQGKGDYLTNEYAILNMTSRFEEHLMRGVPKSGRDVSADNG